MIGLAHDASTIHEAIGSAISQLRWQVEPDAEGEFNRWYDEEHLADLLAQPGVLSGRRFVRAQTAFSAPSDFNYITIYQLADTGALDDTVLSRDGHHAERMDAAGARAVAIAARHRDADLSQERIR